MKHAKAGVVQLLTYTETGLRNTIYKNSRAKGTKYHVKFENNTIWTEICTRMKMNCTKEEFGEEYKKESCNHTQKLVRNHL